jgi:hypothetical protein
MVKDILGNEIKAGDRLAIAQRLGDTASLSIYEVISIEEEKLDGWGIKYHPVKAKQIFSRWKNSTDRLSTLHGDIFSRTALLINNETD